MDVNGESSIDNTSDSINRMSRSAKSADTTFGKLKKKLSDTFSTARIGMTTYIAVLSEVHKASKQLVNTTEDLDKSITDLSIAMNSTRSDATNYLKDLNKQAKDLKVSTKSVAEASDSWLRQGKTIKETNELVRDSIVLSTLGQIETADATKYLTSSLNGFKKSASEAIDIVDKLTYVNAVSGSDAGGLAEALSKTSSAASLAGMSLDKLIGQIATVKEVTQADDSEVGNTFKSIFSRINNIRAGKYTDSETGESLNDTEKILTKLGISMRNTNNEFKSSEEILDTLGERWNTFDSMQQKAIATAVAGTYRYNSFLALMQNYDKVLKYTEASLNSTGTAMEKFNQSYKESLQAKKANLTAAFESLTINSDFESAYGSIIEATTALVTFLDKTNALKGLATGVITGAVLKGFVALKTGISEAYVTLNQFHRALQISKQTQISTEAYENMLLLSKNLSVSQMKLIVSSKALSVEQREQLLIASGLSAEQSRQILTTAGLATAETGLTASTMSLSAAFKALGATLLANPIFLIATALSAGVMVWQSYEQKVEEARQSALDTAQATKEEVDSITTLLDKYNQLTEEVKTNTDAKEDWLSTQDDLLEALGIEQSEVEELTKKYGSLSKAINQAAIDKLKDKRTDLLAGYNASKEEVVEVGKNTSNGIGKGLFGGVGLAFEALFADKTITDDYAKGLKILKDKGIITDDSVGFELPTKGKTYEETLENYEKLLEIEKALQEGIPDSEELSENALFNEINNRKQKLEKVIEDTKAYVDDINENEAKIQIQESLLEGELPKTQKEFEEYKKQMIESAKANENFVGSEQDKEDAVINTLSAMSEFEDFFNSANSVNGGVSGNISFSKAFKSLETDTKDALLELASSGELTPETLESTEEYNKLLTETGLTAEEVANKINKMVTSSDQLASMGSGIKSLSDNLATKKEEPKQAIDYDTLAGMSDELKEHTKEWREYEKVMGDANSTYEECRKVTNKLATAFVNSRNFLSNLTDSNKDYYISQLEAMGVENAREIVLNALEKSKAQLALETENLADMTAEEIVQLIDEKAKTEDAADAMKAFALEKIYANSNALDTTEDIQSLINLMEAFGIVATATEEYQRALNGDMGTGGGIDPVKQAEILKKNAQEEIQEAIAELMSIDKKVKVTSKNKDTKSDSAKSKTKESKQLIDWISRKLETLQQKIDLTKSKFENLFSLNSQEKNLKKQISLTEELLKAQENSAKRYQKKANSYYKKNQKKLSANGITLDMLQNGAYNIKSYKSSIADIVSTYEDYYDKAQDAKKATEELLTQIKELSKQKLDLKLDNNERKRKYQEAKYANAITAKAKNQILDKEIETYNSDNNAYAKYYEKAVTSRQDVGKKAKKAVTNTKGLSKADKKKIKNKIKKGEEIPSNLMKKVKNVNTNVYNKLVAYNNEVDFVADVLRDKKLADEENKTNIRETKVEQHQNLADEYSTQYDLNQLYEEEAISSKDKNDYEKESRKSLRNQYKQLIAIAKLEGDVIEQKRLQAELDQKLDDSYKKEYDNIKEEYDNILSRYEARKNTLQAEIDALTANGRVALKSIYDAMKESLQDSRKTAMEELEKLESAEFEYGSDDWYDQQLDIEEKTQEIYAIDSALADLAKTMNDLAMQEFNLKNLEINRSNDHISFLKDYLSHNVLTSEDAVGFTMEGLATISLDFAEMENNNKTIENAQKALAELNEQYQRGELSLEDYIEATGEWNDILRDAISGNKELEDSILDLVDEAFNVQLDVLSDLIDKKKNQLSIEKEIYDYQRKVANQTKAIASIEKQIASLVGDTSEEAKMRIQKLQLELSDAEQDLKDTEYEKYLSDQEDMLDDLSDEMENFFENLLKKPEELLSAIEKAIKDMPEKLAEFFASMGLGDAHSFDTTTDENGDKNVHGTDYNGNNTEAKFDKDGVNVNNTYDSTLPSRNTSSSNNSTKEDSKQEDLVENVKDTITGLPAVMQPIADSLMGTLDDVLSIVSPEYREQKELEAQKQADAKRDAEVGKQRQIEALLDKSLYKPSNTSDQMRIPNNKFLQYLDKKYNKRIVSKKKELEIAKILGVAIKDKDNITREESIKLRDAFKNAGFATGGIAHFDSGIIRKVGEDGIVLARNGEGFVSPENVADMKRFMETIPVANNLITDMIKVPNYASMIQARSNPINIGDVNVHLDGSNVMDMNTMFQELEKPSNKRRITNLVASPLLNGDMLRKF